MVIQVCILRQATHVMEPLRTHLHRHFTLRWLHLRPTSLGLISANSLFQLTQSLCDLSMQRQYSVDLRMSRTAAFSFRAGLPCTAAEPGPRKR